MKFKPNSNGFNGFGWAVGGIMLLNMTLFFLLAYVVYHFISKWW